VAMPMPRPTPSMARAKRRVAKSWQRAQITLAITRARLPTPIASLRPRTSARLPDAITAMALKITVMATASPTCRLLSWRSRCIDTRAPLTMPMS